MLGQLVARGAKEGLRGLKRARGGKMGQEGARRGVYREQEGVFIGVTGSRLTEEVELSSSPARHAWKGEGDGHNM
jgi:hypothetical protein